MNNKLKHDFISINNSNDTNKSEYVCVLVSQREMERESRSANFCRSSARILFAESIAQSSCILLSLLMLSLIFVASWLGFHFAGMQSNMMNS